MSPLWRDELRIALEPDRVTLLRVGRGWTGRLKEARMLPVEAGASPSWQAGLAALREALPGFAGRGAAVRVVLSNHFVCYGLLDAPPRLPDDAAGAAYVRHRFRAIHGERADGWTLRWTEADAADAWLACGAEQSLLAALGDALGASACRALAVQPYFAAAYNRFRRHLGAATHWFAVAEPGRLMLGLAGGRGWHGLRSLRIRADCGGESWAEELPRILERERLLGNETAQEAGLCLFAPELAVPLPENGSVAVRQLSLPPLPGLDPSLAGPLAMALCA